MRLVRGHEHKANDSDIHVSAPTSRMHPNLLPPVFCYYYDVVSLFAIDTA